MSWWHWILVAIGVIALIPAKLAFFNRMKQAKTTKKFDDED